MSEQHEESGAGVIKLPGTFSISSVEKIYELVNSAPATQRIKLDGADVEVMDAAALQLLLAAQKRQASHGGGVDWLEASDYMKQIVRMLSLQSQLPGLAD
ncbi:STAS domain-containing protein [Hahella sp. KA22]|uniref:STAS domain-containing protein n=1 Tax=Hahella sp. KA22 TaxID=1628392 RepID=UPI000FDD0AD8|nr:STAS domain-containing protein [Hahella sp. KA22]AZZ90003.1 STAS domain-containing protein [Hahella sp. KA22]QAY53373.1 STAS domain-containing protein [Hahella sp. KA22]